MSKLSNSSYKLNSQLFPSQSSKLISKQGQSIPERSVRSPLTSLTKGETPREGFDFFDDVNHKDIDSMEYAPYYSEIVTRFENWSLPAQGEPYDTCGKFGYRGCLNVESHSKIRSDGVSYQGLIFVEKHRHSCNRASCPICWENWLRLEANYMTERILSKTKKVIHVIVSPSMKDCLKYPIRRLREKAGRRLSKVGLRGGSLIFHPFRQRCKSCKGNVERDDSFLKKCVDCGSNEFEWYVSPHFHALGFGWISKTGEEYKKQGWIIKNLGLRKSVYHTAHYQLSHAGVHSLSEDKKILSNFYHQGKKHTVSWIGELSTVKYKFERKRGSRLCPICEHELVALRWSDPLKGVHLKEDICPLESKKEGEWFVSSYGWSLYSKRDEVLYNIHEKNHIDPKRPDQTDILNSQLILDGNGSIMGFKVWKYEGTWKKTIYEKRWAE